MIEPNADREAIQEQMEVILTSAKTLTYPQFRSVALASHVLDADAMLFVLLACPTCGDVGVPRVDALGNEVMDRSCIECGSTGRRNVKVVDADRFERLCAVVRAVENIGRPYHLSYLEAIEHAATALTADDIERIRCCDDDTTQPAVGAA